MAYRDGNQSKVIRYQDPGSNYGIADDNFLSVGASRSSYEISIELLVSVDIENCR